MPTRIGLKCKECSNVSINPPVKVKYVSSEAPWATIQGHSVVVHKSDLGTPYAEIMQLFCEACGRLVYETSIMISTTNANVVSTIIPNNYQTEIEEPEKQLETESNQVAAVRNVYVDNESQARRMSKIARMGMQECRLCHRIYQKKLQRCPNCKSTTTI
jgi:predicted Zn-ribbon and HTH transcriptional regulator